jgi:putative ABC transport system permease protein
VKDFKTSLKNRTRGEIFFNTKSSTWDELDFFLVKIEGADLNTSIQQIKGSWSEAFPGTPFDYFFLDTYFDTFYREERQFAGVFGFFCFIGVAVACLGLYGLSSYNTTSRTKEIGIRKSLGASARGIIWMFSKDYVRLVIAASAVGIPVGMWALNEWLQNYPNRINLQADVVVMPLLIMLVIAIATVGSQTYRSAQTNPVEALKYAE